MGARSAETSRVGSPPVWVTAKPTPALFLRSISRDRNLPIMADSTPTPAIKTVPKPRDQHLRDMADCIRFLSMDAVQQANSGHPGAPLGMLGVATVLFRDFIKFDAADPNWFDRDRIVLSNGQLSMLLYSALYLTGVQAMTLND